MPDKIESILSLRVRSFSGALVPMSEASAHPAKAFTQSRDSLHVLVEHREDDHRAFFAHEVDVVVFVARHAEVFTVLEDGCLVSGLLRYG